MGSKEYFLRLREEEYFDLPLHLRERTTVHYNDYNDHKDDPVFMALYKAKKTAQNKLDEYKFKKRHENATTL